jgi:hypothetical protein
MSSTRAFRICAASVLLLAFVQCGNEVFTSNAMDAGALDGGPGDASTEAGPDATADPELCADDEPNDAGPTSGLNTVQCGDSSVLVKDNPLACGSCAHVCTPLACAGLACGTERLAPGGGGNVMAGADDASVYWLGGAGGTGLYRAAAPDATAAIFVYDGGTGVSAAQIAPGEVWVAAFSGDLFVVNPNDGQARLVLSDPKGISLLAIDEASVYFYAPGGTLKRVSKDGGTLASAEPLSAAPVTALAADKWGQAWSVSGADGGAASIHLRNAAGMATTPIPASNPNGLALTSRYVYWVDGGVLYRARRDLADPRAVRTGSWDATLTKSNGIAVDDDYVYWSITDAAQTNFFQIVRTPRCGGPTLLVATPEVGTSGPVVGGGFFYWNQVNGFGNTGAVARSR